MPNYLYEAAASDGTITRGAIDAPSRSMAVERIIGLGRTPVRVVENEGTALPHSRGTATLLPQFNLANDRLVLLQQFSILLRAGLSVERSLIAMLALTSKARTKGAIQSLLDGLRGGEPLSGAMRRAERLFPEPLRKLVAAGEASGRLPDVMTRLATAHARNKELADKIISAMIYPALLVAVMFAVLIMIFTVVLPRLEPLFEQSGAALPWPAAVLLGISHFLDAYGIWFAVALIGSFAGQLYALRQPAVQVTMDRRALSARFLLKVPQHYQAAQFCRNLAMLLDGGMPLNRALDTAQAAVTNSYIRQSLNVVIDRVKHGRSLKLSLEEANVFPRVTLEFVAVGEETGRLGPMLNEAADVLDRDVQLKLDRLSALLLPVVTIFLGIVVAGIMSGVVSGILAANDLAL